MPRRKKPKKVQKLPKVYFYKPRGIPLSSLEVNLLTIEEMEAIRLRDLKGLHMEEAAQHMNISRRTFSRLLKSAHYKIADAFFNGKAIGVIK